jgi:hypothetical protein
MLNPGLYELQYACYVAGYDGRKYPPLHDMTDTDFRTPSERSLAVSIFRTDPSPVSRTHWLRTFYLPGPLRLVPVKTPSIRA